VCVGRHGEIFSPTLRVAKDGAPRVPQRLLCVARKSKKQVLPVRFAQGRLYAYPIARATGPRKRVPQDDKRFQDAEKLTGRRHRFEVQAGSRCVCVAIQLQTLTMGSR